jgi:hypothetical protein
MPRKNSKKARTTTTVVDGQRISKTAPKKKRVTKTTLADGTKVRTVDNSKKIKRTETRTTRAQSKVDGINASNATRTGGGLKAKKAGKLKRKQTKASKLANKTKKLVGTKSGTASKGNSFKYGDTI